MARQRSAPTAHQQKECLGSGSPEPPEHGRSPAEGEVRLNLEEVRLA
jgi:hypothetical protein